MRTPAVNPKLIATIPIFISVSLISVLIYFDERLHLFFSPLILGILAGGIVDLDNGLTGKLKNIMFTMLAFAISSLSIQLTFSQPIVLAITFTILAFVFTFIGAAGARYRTIAFGTLAVAVYTSLTHGKGQHAWYINSLLIMCGTLLYSGLAILIHILFPYRPVQENMANAYAALGNYLQVKSNFFDPDEVDCFDQQELNLAMDNVKIINAFNLCRTSLFYRLRGQHRHPRTTKMLHFYFVAQDIHERISSSHIPYKVFAEQMKFSDLIFRIQKMLRLQAQACRDFAKVLRSNKDIYHYSAQLERTTQGAEQSLLHYAQHPSEIAPYRAQRLLDNITYISLQFAHLGNSDIEDFDEGNGVLISSPDAGGFKGAWRAIRGQITPQSPVFRHAVRMAIIVLLSCILIPFSFEINRLLLPNNASETANFGFWILLTGIFVCQPNYSATKKRLVQRILGTTMGVLVGSFLPIFNLPLEMKLVIVVLSTTLFFFFRTNKYSFSTFFINIQAITGFSIMGHNVTLFFAPRIVDTVLGAFIAGLAVYFIWPDWKYLALDKTGAQAIRANAGYLKAILVQLKQYGMNNDISYRRARRVSHDRAVALSSTVSDMSSDPNKYTDKLQDAFSLLKINYSLISYISALGAYRNKMHRIEEDSDDGFLKQFFLIADQIVEILENMNDWDNATFLAAYHKVHNGLEDLRPDYSKEDTQNQVLWQQLMMISGLLEACYQALHQENKSSEMAMA